MRGKVRGGKGTTTKGTVAWDGGAGSERDCLPKGAQRNPRTLPKQA